MEEHYVPKYLHAKPQLLSWELDEIMIWLPFIGAGVVSGQAPLFALIGYLIMRFYIRLKNNRQDGYLAHFFYKLGLYNPDKKKFPEYWIKELVR
ncbi:MAG TPA: type IV conjugative transfer system protein TraL [Aigarchaeota archaeon]|nr:type IV conjugative transfer system protein TraL [Aigarchaeota archaeon]